MVAPGQLGIRNKAVRAGAEGLLYQNSGVPARWTSVSSRIALSIQQVPSHPGRLSGAQSQNKYAVESEEETAASGRHYFMERVCRRGSNTPCGQRTTTPRVATARQGEGVADLSQEAGTSRSHPGSKQKRAWTCDHQEVTCGILHGRGLFSCPGLGNPRAVGLLKQRKGKRTEAGEEGWPLFSPEGPKSLLPAESGEPIRRAAPCI